jgi:hypothetical protein
MNDAMWAIAIPVRADNDIFSLPRAKGAIFDPAWHPENFTLTKMDRRDSARPCLTSRHYRGAARQGAEEPRHRRKIEL